MALAPPYSAHYQPARAAGLVAKPMAGEVLLPDKPAQTIEEQMSL
jgi:hypothetical protein